MKVFIIVLVLFFSYRTTRLAYYTWKQETKPAAIAICLLAAAYPAIGLILIMK